LEVGSLKFHAYPTMLAVAFLTATLLAVRHLNRLEPPIRATTHGGLAAFFGGLIGAKAFWILQYGEDPSKIWQAVFFWTSGFVFYGGLIGAIVAVLAYLLYNRLPVLRTADACAPYLALGEAITRVGCFLTGCCWGRETNLPWALRFPRASSVHWYMRRLDPPALDSADLFTPALHPTQLYMCLGLLLVVFPLLLYLLRKPHFRGSIALGYMFCYGILRFTVEAFRGDSGHPAFGMTLSQLISLGLAVFSLIAFALIKSTIFSRQPAEAEADQSPE
jgi:phosphatidylglycerol:prolipoprotein diacylglycerol transferase